MTSARQACSGEWVSVAHPDESIRCKDGVYRKAGYRLVLFFLAWVWILNGCMENTGPAGPEGPAGSSLTLLEGRSGVVPQGDRLLATIESVEMHGTPVVTFRVVDGAQRVFTALPSADFTLAKLVPGSDGTPPHWQSYLNRVEQAGTGDWPGTVATLQASSESTGDLENLGEGRYRYTFLAAPGSLEKPELWSELPASERADLRYDPIWTHRVGLQIGGASSGLPTANAIHTFQPATGLTSPSAAIRDRRLVTQEACNRCHGDTLSAHDNRYIQVDSCVICHNPGTRDAQSGESLDFGVLMHRIHRGNQLPSVLGGKDYRLWGADFEVQDYSTVSHPQDVRHCTQCHDPALTSATAGPSFATAPTRTSCGSCHDDVNFAVGHGGPSGNRVGPQHNDQLCSTCHSAGMHTLGIQSSHTILTYQAAKTFTLQITALELFDNGAPLQPGQVPNQARILFTITDPQQDRFLDPGDDTLFRNLGASLNWIEPGSSEYRFAASQGARSDFGNLQNAQRIGDTTFASSVIAIRNLRVSSPPKTFVVSLYGSAWLDGANSEVVRIRSATAFFDAQGNLLPSGAGRREILSATACQNCHEKYSGYREDTPSHLDFTENASFCVTCHNLNWQHPEPPRSRDFMHLVHGIHSANYRGSTYDDLRYPNRMSQCLSCHSNDSYHLTQLPLDKPASRFPDGLFGPGPWVSAQSSVCVSCHQGNRALNHMRQNGGQLGEHQVDNTLETCTICHGPGRTADIAELHRLH